MLSLVIKPYKQEVMNVTKYYKLHNVCHSHRLASRQVQWSEPDSKKKCKEPYASKNQLYTSSHCMQIHIIGYSYVRILHLTMLIVTDQYMHAAKLLGYSFLIHI